MSTISVLDLAVGVVTLLFLVRGLLRGLINEVMGFVGILLALFVAGRFYPQLVPQFEGIVGHPRWTAGLSYAVIFIGTLVAVSVAAAIVRKFMTFTFTAWLDNLLGAFVGLLKGVLVSAIIVALFQRFAPDSTFLKGAVSPAYLDSIIAFARSLLPAFLDAVSSL